MTRTSTIFLCATQSLGQEQEKFNPAGTIKERHSAIEKVLEETETPAAGLILVNGDSIVWVAGYYIPINPRAHMFSLFRTYH